MKTKFLPLVLATSLMAVDADAQTGKHSFAIVSGDNAVITDADIVEYRFAEHALKIRGESLLRMARQRPPLSGDPFHVVVNGERILFGSFYFPSFVHEFQGADDFSTGRHQSADGHRHHLRAFAS